MQKASPLATSHRINYLDSVRGLAALAVVFYHFLGWHWGETLTFHLSSMVFNGSDAVSLFFVLSGLVLSWKYFQPDQRVEIDGAHYKEYVVNRVVRLYLPFLVAIVVIYYFLNHRHDDAWPLITGFLTNENHWMEEALLIRGKHDMYNPGWTLEVELAASLLLPFLVLLLRKSRQLFYLLGAVYLVLGPPWVMSQIFHFMLGMTLAYFFPLIARFDVRASRYANLRYLVYLLAFVLFSIRHITRIFPLSETANYWMGLLRIDLFYLTGLGAFILLAYIINSPRLQRGLSVSPLLFLGRISYSVYLVHWFFVDQVMKQLDIYLPGSSHRRLTILAALLLTVGATIFCATVFNVLVERPAIRLGKRLSARFASVRHTQVVA
jgi:peptidoglycan/LPS O-acetylase OafA/YrhL